MNIVQTVKDHPFYVIGGLAGAVVVYILLTTNGGGAQSAVPGDIYGAQGIAGTSVDQSSVALSAQAANIAGQIELALMPARLSAVCP